MCGFSYFLSQLLTVHSFSVAFPGEGDKKTEKASDEWGRLIVAAFRRRTPEIGSRHLSFYSFRFQHFDLLPGWRAPEMQQVVPVLSTKDIANRAGLFPRAHSPG